jgi:glycosyltransferase involved in cell wall biosynthesis
MSLVKWHIAVLIPARDEEQLLPRCLRSVLEACLRLPAGVTSDIVIVADRSTDTTRDIAEDLIQRNGVVIETNAGCVGTSRALAAEIALDATKDLASAVGWRTQMPIARYQQIG